MQVKVSQAVSMLTTYIKAKLVPLLIGSPGIGKSAIVHKIAQQYNLLVIDVRLSQCDPTDLMGFPQISGSKAGYVPMDTFPLEGDPVPKGYSGWLLFFDELTSALPAIQAAAYKIILDRMVGQHKLHKQVAIVGAGNKESDNAIVQPMSTALQSRLVHLELLVDVQEFTDYAAEAGFDHRISDFIKFKPGMAYTFKADHTDDTYACPRTWEFADRILKATEEGSPDRLPLLAGAISEGVAVEFLTFMKIYADLPKMSEILNSPDSVRVPEEPSILFALTGSLAHNITPDNAKEIIQYVKRMPVEFQVVMLRETVRRNKAMNQVPAIQKWVVEFGHAMFS